MKHIFLILSAFLPLIGPVIYVWEVLNKNVKPSRITWFVWFFISLITTVSLLVEGSKTSIWISGVMLIQSFGIFLLSLKYGKARWNRVDIIALFLACFGIFGWIITKDPVIALIFSIIADFSGLLPTLIKSYKEPYEESWIFYLIDTFASAFNLLAISNFVWKDAIYSVYLLFANLAVVSMILGRRL